MQEGIILSFSIYKPFHHDFFQFQYFKFSCINVPNSSSSTTAISIVLNGFRFLIIIVIVFLFAVVVFIIPPIKLVFSE